MFLSIIIPVYNLEKYIAECLESCLNQDFVDYEIICVNDGSKDNSGEILDRYSRKYPERIRVFHQENAGVSCARNFGINMAQGKWIWCVDGDDVIGPNCINVFADNIKEDDEFVMFDLDKGTNVNLSPITNDIIKCQKIEYSDVFVKAPTNSYGGGAYAHWFRRENLQKNNLRFDERMRYSEDVKLIFEYKLLSKNGGRLFDNVVYYYREQPDSAMHNVNYEEQIKCMRILTELYQKALSENPEQRTQILKRRIMAMQVIQFDLLYKIKNYNRAKEQIQEWEDKGLYPYKMPKLPRIKRKKQKRKLKVRFADFLYSTFQYKRMYLFLCKIFSKL